MNTKKVSDYISSLKEKTNEIESLLSGSNSNEITIRNLAEEIHSISEKLRDSTLEREETSIPDLKGKKILLVEDNNINLMVEVAFMKKTGATVETAENGLEAVEKILNSEKNDAKFDLVFMDMQMPVMNGVEAVKTLKNHSSKYANTIPIVTLTGSGLDSEKSTIESLGINGYILKPVTAKQMYLYCENILQTGYISSSEKEIEKGNKTDIKPESKPAPNTAANSSFPDFSSKNVLVVDDNKLNVEIINLMLKKTGASFVNAFDGQEALNMYLESDEKHFDMILMDIQMPVMNGNECAAKIRASGRSDASLPIIAISANAFQEDKDKSLQAGINFHMSKPVNMKSLHAKMVELFDL